MNTTEPKPLKKQNQKDILNKDDGIFDIDQYQKKYYRVAICCYAGCCCCKITVILKEYVY